MKKALSSELEKNPSIWLFRIAISISILFTLRMLI